MKRKKNKQGGRAPDRSADQPISADKRSTSSSAPNLPAAGKTSERAEQRDEIHKAGPPGPDRQLSTGRKWVYRLATLTLVPLLVLGALEMCLRIGGYGYPTDFFKPLRIGTEDYLVENDKFGLRFFPPQLARSPAPVAMKAHKPPGTFRIFILGESAALGDPRPAYGPGRYLQALLEERFPEQKFEVICVAMTAINSHALLPIARECAQHEGDCWILYLGNNEMVGPFGAATVFGPSALLSVLTAARRRRFFVTTASSVRVLLSMAPVTTRAAASGAFSSPAWVAASRRQRRGRGWRCS